MKRLVLITSFAFAAIFLNGQGYVPSREDIMAFFSTKTLVVLEDNPMMEYNSIIKKVMQQEWTVTPYEFITDKEFEERRMDPQYSFIYMSKVTFESDKTDAAYRFLHLSLGGDYFRLNEMPDIASVPLSYYSVDEDSYAFKLAILVRFLQNHTKLLREKPEIISANVFKYYNDNIRSMHGKTLYVLKEELAPVVSSLGQIRKIYGFPVKITTREEIETAIRNRDTDVVFLHKVGPEGTKLNARCYKIIIGAADANFYYFDYHKINEKNPDGFLESDFKNLAK